MMQGVEQLQKLFVEGEFLTPEDFEKAKTSAETSGTTVLDAIVDLGLLSDTEVGSLVADQYGLVFVDLSKERIEHDVLLGITKQSAKGQMAVPYKRTDEGVWVATDNPDNYEFFQSLQKLFKQPVKLAYASRIGIQEVLKMFEKDPILQARELVQRMSKESRDEDVVVLVDLILASAHGQRASDIHIEPEEDSVVIRFRIDGSMHEVLRYPVPFHEKVIFRIKILSRLRTDEHLQAQDGRFEVKSPDGLLNLRVSILPITRGENVVMRLLSERFQRLRLEDLGLAEDDLVKMKRAAELPHGMILAAGPTGSGKTTTLYALLHILNQPDVNLMTIEDPVEYDIRGIRQIQVNTRTNLTFGAGLKSIVRQDPDSIMVGEIRDPETAEIAINAALTGHLLLSTLHANDAATAFPRLFEMQVQPFLIASSVNVIVAQRLVRKNCTHCLESYMLEPSLIETIEADKHLLALIQKRTGTKDIRKIRLYHGRGCSVCNNIGYIGRMGIYEIFEVTEEIRPLIVNRASSDEIRRKAIEGGMRTMFEDGLNKAFSGQTTLNEILRETIM